MSKLRPNICKLAVVSILALITVNTASAITVSLIGYPGTITESAYCPGPQTPGYTELKPITYLPPTGWDAWVIDALEWQFSGENRYTAGGTQYRPPEERWTFSWGDSLNGTLFIDLYEAYDRHHRYELDAKGNLVIVWDESGPYCRHGAHLSTNYFSNAADPPIIEWVQIFVASYVKHGVPAGTPLVDPFYNDGTDDAPFYFSNLDNPDNYYRGTNPHKDLIFGDTPGASHLETEPYSVSLELYLYLCSFEFLVDPVSGSILRHVTLHDGISWGYVGLCVPEPATVILLGLGVLALLRRRRG